MIESHRDLRVWQKSMDLAERAYRCSQKMPSSETFGLISQIRRAAVSVPANIAEGYGRQSGRSYEQFLKTARGSLLELETHIMLAGRVDMLDQTNTRELLREIEIVSRMLSGLISSVANHNIDGGKRA